MLIIVGRARGIRGCGEAQTESCTTAYFTIENAIMITIGKAILTVKIHGIILNLLGEMWMKYETLIELLQEEMKMGLKGGLYHQTQIKLAYNSNRIEGSRLSEDQTRYIFETNTINVEPEETASVDDIIETVNHFACFDYMLNLAHEDLSEEMIKEFHRILKRNTSDERKDWFRVGDYKVRPNVVGDMKTTAPGKVASAMGKLLTMYHQKPGISFEDIVDFHHEFESIHPFQDGNGRVGRIILFKECLKNGILPFIIDHEYKLFYYRGLKEYSSEKGYLLDTCLSAQDRYEAEVAYFFPELKRLP
ncbi:Fic family protein [Paenibacillus sp. FSL L8-0470]|uniref:Fic family protein n=1 Tax=unclassified Paenibacillus TaxID=185978 RepID=UPI0030F72205